MAGPTTVAGRALRMALAAGVLTVAPWLSAAPAHAAGSAPDAPVLVGPVDAATGVAAPAALSVKVSDPESDPLTVRFFARQRDAAGAATSSPDFTWMTIPDTQNYVSIAANRALMGAQTQWIADQRSALNIALVSHLGDVTGQPDSDSQYAAASGYLSTLDNASVPNTVLPGNHDLNLADGSAPLYDRYFPPSRYAGASWNSPTVTYGGYLGQNLFGPDPVDRQNKDSFVLLTAGGMDFVAINLEFNAPDYALDWAKKVLAAYPTRRAILFTHNMIGVDGEFSFSVNRPDGNYPTAMWDELVGPSCRFFMVVNGHNHDGDAGEAFKTVTDACGGTVRLALADYQSRPNGGDGWLRYFVFHPSQNQIEAVTYSPTLGRFETDTDSAFTIPYDMTGPAPYAQVGEVSVASGDTATVTLPGTSPSRGYDWYATVTDQTSTTTSPTWSFATAAATPPPAPVTLLGDDFERTVANGWGSADTGGAWTANGTASRYAVGGGSGQQTVPAGVTTTSTSGVLSATDVDVSARLSFSSIPNGTVYSSVLARRVGTADYSARVKVAPGGGLTLQLMRSGTVLSTGTIPAATVAAEEQFRVRIQATGTQPTALRAKVWKADATEPSGWQVTATDATAGLQAAGAVGLSTYLSSSATNGPLLARLHDITVTGPGGTTPTTPPATPPPTTPPPTTPPAPANLVADAFGRTAASGWGTADTGGAWTVTGTAGRYAVSGGVGTQTVARGASSQATVAATSSTRTDTTVKVSLSAVPSGGAVYVYVGGRRVGTTEYGARVKVDPGGALSLHTARGDTTLTGAPLGLTLAAGDVLNVRVQVDGSSPTTIRAKAWKSGSTEPTGWTATSTDATAGLQSAGGVSLRTYASSAVTAASVTARFDDLVVRAIG